MKNKINCIMLVNDNPDDNFFHERVIKKYDASTIVVTKQTGMAALEYLKSKQDYVNTHPSLILLDINMPGMNGWEFLEAYNKLDKQFQSDAIVVMLTTSGNPADEMKVNLSESIAGFKIKPLTRETMEEIVHNRF